MPAFAGRFETNQIALAAEAFYPFPGKMGHFVHCYPDCLARLNSILGAGESAPRAQILAANQDLIELNAPSAETTTHALDQLLRGSYPKSDDEHPAAPDLIYAFHWICRAAAGNSRAEVEIYVDEEQFPEINEFVWGANPTPFQIPLSPYGSPAVGHWPASAIGQHLDAFNAIDFEALHERADADYRADVAALCRCLAVAQASASGVFVFFFE